MKKLIFASLLLTAKLYAQPGTDVCPIKNGSKIPAGITLTNIKGQSVKLDSIVNSKPTVIVFFRGGWCPFCNKHLGELQEAKRTIDSLGYQLVAITPDKFTNLDSSYKSSGAEYMLLSDNEAKAIQAFGVAWKIDDKTYLKYKNEYGMDAEFWSGKKHHLLPVPSVFVARKNMIEFNYVNPNFTVRLKGKTLASVLSTL